ncbi:unnamed protein product [Lactuca virosa]|uniref:Helitron helicase-like domain-containing protein n=1 Tax=Lactuca virosa TaxID=75947 RepID=A0AAU9PT55_9ASTR|nr:unnamed protein product [Lactuca virosa]
MRSSTSSGITRDSSINLSFGNQTLKRKNANISAIPFLDLTSDEDLNDHHILKDVISGLSKDYLDHGDETLVCAICHAKLWKDEAHRGNKSGKNTYFSMCCGKGKVELPELKEAPPEYLNLYRHLDPKSKYFMKNIRRFNSMFSFTSMGGKIDSSINKGNAPYTFRLSGQNYHSMGSLIPSYGSKPKFSQLYIYDTQNEVSNRQNAFSKEKDGCISPSHSLDIETIQFLKVMLDSTNELVKWYRMARDCFSENPHMDLKLRLIGRRQKDGRTYNLPTASEVAALIVGDIGDSIDNRDIIVTTQSGSLQHINELHPTYLALQYPLLFPYGDDGYRVDIPHRGVTPSTDTKRRNCIMREFFAYRIQDRVNIFSLVLNSKRLFQQFLVDAYTMIESERLYYVRNQQKVLRCESYETLRSLQSHGNTDISNIGKRVILPSSFTGGARLVSKNAFENLSANGSKDSSCMLYSETDEFLLKHDFKPITEIQEITKVSRVIVLGTVKRVCTDFSWYYWGCKSCHKKVDEDIMMNIELNDGSTGKKAVVCSSSVCNNKVVSVLPSMLIPTLSTLQPLKSHLKKLPI